jgi:hypothetical protein
MKKGLYLLLALAMAAILAACGASNDGGVVVDPNASAGQSAQSSQGGAKVTGGASAAAEAVLFYEAGGVKVHPYDLADSVLSALGEPLRTFESDSCAYQGKDYFYSYDGFQLTVNEVDGAKHVTAIKVLDDTVSIPQGVKIGSTEDEMKNLMGDDYTGASGMYTFAEGTTTLQIIVKEGAVASIEYLYTPPVS